MPKLMHDLILEELTWLIACRANTGGEVGAPPLPESLPMLRPAQRDEIESDCVRNSGIVPLSCAVCGSKACQRQPSGNSCVLIGKGNAAPVNRRRRSFTPCLNSLQPDQQERGDQYSDTQSEPSHRLLYCPVPTCDGTRMGLPFGFRSHYSWCKNCHVIEPSCFP